MTPTQTLTVQFAFPSEESPDMKVFAINGVELPDWQHGPTFFEYLSQMQKEGWHVLRGTTNAITFEREGPNSN